MATKDELMVEAEYLLEQMEVLRETARFEAGLVDKYVAKYSDEELERMGEEELEGVFLESERLLARLGGSVRNLQKMNQRYMKLRGEVNGIFGREVLPPLAGFTLPGLGDEPIDMRGGWDDNN